MKLGRLALGQRGRAYAQGEWELFLVQTDAIRNGREQLDLGDDVHGDRVGIVFGTQSSGREGHQVISRSLRRERKAVEDYPAGVRAEEIVPREERRAAEGGKERRTERERVWVGDARGGVEVVMCA